MEVKQLKCPSCNAPIDITEDTSKLICSFCGASLVIEHDEGVLSTKLVEDVEKAIRESGDQTISIIRNQTITTQSELKNLHIQQKISTLQNQLSSINFEIRGLERGKRSIKQRKQLKELKTEKKQLGFQIKRLEKEIYGDDSEIKTQQQKRVQSDGLFKSGCISGVIAIFVFGLIFGGLGDLFDALIFSEDDSVTPFSSLAMMVSIVGGIIVFIYRYKPNSKISLAVKEKINKIGINKIPKWVLIGGILFLIILCSTIGSFNSE